jgi:hypothetical protein
MNLALLLPAGLAALAALLLPLLIHLARRSEQRITDFAALRWLSSKPRPRRKRRFDERLLLLLRLLLLAALALLLAGPVLYGRPDRTPWIVAAPDVGATALRDAAGAANARRHWLAPGFPAIDGKLPPGKQPVASLLRELDARLPAGTPLTVLVPSVIDGADAERPKLSRDVEWRALPSTASPPAPVATIAMPSLSVRAASEHLPALRYLRAAGAAWHAAAPAAIGTSRDAATSPITAPSITIAPPSQALDAGTRNLAWLVPGPLPVHVRDWIRAGGRALLASDVDAVELANATPLWRDDDGQALVRGTALGRGRIMQLTRELKPAVMPQLLEADFPERLRVLFVDPAPAPARVAASAYAPTTGAPPWPETPRPLSPWLVILVALLFAIERWLANGPRRGAAP